jgi:hypothetical protein
MVRAVQGITILGLAVCLGMLYLRAKAAKTGSASSTKRRLKTAHVLLIALAVWLVVNFNLQRLNGALSGQPVGELSAWERIVRFLAGGN